MVLAVMFDTNVFDWLLMHERALNIVRERTGSGALKILITSVQMNELGAISDLEKRIAVEALIQSLHVELIPVSFAPYGYAYGECYGGKETGVTLDTDALVNGRKHVEDVMIAATSTSLSNQINILITQDRRLRNRLNSLNGNATAIAAEEFCQLLQQIG